MVYVATNALVVSRGDHGAPIHVVDQANGPLVVALALNGAERRSLAPPDRLRHGGGERKPPPSGG
jgi:hypothetical protein